MNTKNSKKIVPATVFAAIIVLLAFAVVSQAAPDTTIYDKDHQSGWAAAVVTWETEDFTDAILNPGVSVVTDNGYVDTTKGVWWDKLDCPAGTTTTTWQFDRPIFAFGGTWNPFVPGGPGANIDVAINGGWVNVGEIPNVYFNEFWGFTSTVPFSQVRLQAGSNPASCERYELDDMVYSFQPIEVEKDYRYTNVCFVKDNDPEVDCPDGTSLGDPLEMDGENYIVEAVVKNDMVKSYNPGQYYAVSTVNVLVDVDTLTIVEDWCDCTSISALSPANGGGCVVIVEVGPDGVPYQIHDANSDEVTVVDCTATAMLGAVSAGTTILMYVKFGPAQKHLEFDPDTCENVNSAEANFGLGDSASATLELIEKEWGN